MNYTEFAAKLRGLGLSREAFARKAGVSLSQVQRYATDKAKIPELIVMAIQLLESQDHAKTKG